MDEDFCKHKMHLTDQLCQYQVRQPQRCPLFVKQKFIDVLFINGHFSIFRILATSYYFNLTSHNVWHHILN